MVFHYNMTIVNISNHGRITIPSKLRKKYGWNDGDKVIIIDDPTEGIKILPHPVSNKRYWELRLPGIISVQVLKRKRIRPKTGRQGSTHRTDHAVDLL